jgi:hypothetical protein
VTDAKPVYPDISDILARKAQGRRDINAKLFVEKILIVEALRERIAPFKRLRDARKATNQEIGSL